MGLNTKYIDGASEGKVGKMGENRQKNKGLCKKKHSPNTL